MILRSGKAAIGKPSLGSRLDAYKGMGPGFDNLRVILAFAVIGWHCIPLTVGSAAPAKHTIFWPAIYAIVPAFFALSGFLVTGSALRLNLGKFAFSRILRIVPALCVDTLVTILVIGPALTTAPLSGYFSSPVTHDYLLNMIGDVHFALPGLFGNNPYADAVNGSLWTLPGEMGCYLMIGVLIALGWVGDWRKVLVVTALSMALLVGAHLEQPNAHFRVLNILLSPAAKLVPMFFTGATFFLLRHRIPYSWPIFYSCVVALLIPGAFLSADAWWESPIWISITAPLLTYIVAFLGTTQIKSMPIYRKGDYSYGIYLYGFPIQQALVQVAHIRSPILLFVATIVPVTILAMLSWHIVEKPTLKLRRAFSFSAKHEVLNKTQVAQ